MSMHIVSSLIAALLVAGCPSSNPAPLVEARHGFPEDRRTGTPQWYFTCGDPVCRGYTAPDGIAPCSDQKAGNTCTSNGSRCDPKDACSALLLCTDSDPRKQPGGCPISSRRFKRDVTYLDDADLDSLASQVRDIRLTTYRYKTDEAETTRHLGFIIEDMPSSSPAVAPSREMVDLYGYTSMLVASSQVQARRIDALEREVAALHAACTRK